MYLSFKFKQKGESQQCDRRLCKHPSPRQLSIFLQDSFGKTVLIFWHERSFSILPAVDYKLHKGKQLLNPRAAQGM